jgi:hypothetical protein
MYFVSRWREKSPLGKRVVAVPDATVLDWFRRGWGRDTPVEWIANELGGDVYGLDSIFDEARKGSLPAPESMDELRGLLHEHLWVEADDKGDYIRLGEHALRVRTDDDEVDLAYYFIDDEAVAESPDRLAFLVNDVWPLPAGADDSGVFSSGVPVRSVRLEPAGPESVFSVRLPWESPDAARNLDLAGAIEFVGLTLPGLAARLRAVDVTQVEDLPHDARLLRALIAPGEDDLGPALQRYIRLAGYSPSVPDASFLLAQATDGSTELSGPPLLQPIDSLTQSDKHILQAARYIDDFFGFDQWFLFDTQWASAHPDLARSLLRYAAHWDPYGP